MRVTREKAAENRERIVATASHLFREKGFDGVGLDEIMREAGLTHGGFYRHFESKEDLAAEAVAYGAASSTQLLGGLTTQEQVAAVYLSPQHRDDCAGGCMVAGLGSEIARHGAGSRRAATKYICAQIDRIADRIGGRDDKARREKAIATYAGLVGALMLARAVDDPALSDEILAAGRKAFGGDG